MYFNMTTWPSYRRQFSCKISIMVVRGVFHFCRSNTKYFLFVNLIHNYMYMCFKLCHSHGYAYHSGLWSCYKQKKMYAVNKFCGFKRGCIHRQIQKCFWNRQRKKIYVVFLIFFLKENILPI